MSEASESLVLSCEHGGNRIPARLSSAFVSAQRALRSHRGWDIGALGLARRFARELGAPLVATTVSRLAIDANRSLGHRGLFSEWSRDLPAAERERLVERTWRPHRDAVEGLVCERLERDGRALHVSVHSFTPCLDGRERAVDVALLYDPSRAGEREFASRWLAELARRERTLRLRRNQPYRGTADGLTASLRRRFPESGCRGPEDGDTGYRGIELEVSQRFPAGATPRWRRLQENLVASLAAALGATAAGECVRETP